MNTAGIVHRAGGAHAYPVDAENLRVVLQAGRGEVSSASCVHSDRYATTGEERETPLEHVGNDERYDYWSATLLAPTRRVKYRFRLSLEGRVLWFGERGLAPQPDIPPFHYAYINPADEFRLPSWLPGAVIYQIFPDRFWRSASDMPPGVAPWGSEPTWWTKTGGDLAGIRHRLPWLRELGVNCLYLTPVFASPSCHRYDTSDYYRIDPLLGSEEDLINLVGDAHAMGMRVLLDGVFNHCGQDFFAFQDVLAQGRRSKYWNWFRIDSEQASAPRGRVNYETFATSVPEMPKLMTQEPAVREYLLGVAERWLQQAAIDGWRLDVANEVDHLFWRQFRERVRTANPQAFILGEVWCDALPWLQGDQYDAVTHYPWRETVLDFLNGRLDVAGFDAALTRLRFMYPGGATGALVHLLGSHDTPRLLTEVGGSRELAGIGAVLLLTAQGVPLVYYGDEVGMAGGNDPECRRCMVWEADAQDRDLLGLYRRLIRLRRALPWLNTGEWRTLVVDSGAGVYVYERSGKLAPNAARAGVAVEAPDERIWVFINLGREQRHVSVPDLPKRTVHLLVPESTPVGEGGILLPPLSAAVIGEADLARRLLGLPSDAQGRNG